MKSIYGVLKEKHDAMNRDADAPVSDDEAAKRTAAAKEQLLQRLTEAVTRAIGSDTAARFQRRRLVQEMVLLSEQDFFRQGVLQEKFQASRVTIQRDVRFLKKLGWVRPLTGKRTGKFGLTEQGRAFTAANRSRIARSLRSSGVNQQS